MTKFIRACSVASALVLAASFSASAVADEVADSSSVIVGKMGTAVGQLKKLDTGKPTQTTQKEIVSNLDALIAQLEKECEGCKGPKPANPTKPGESKIRSGPGGMGDLHAAKKEGKQWGELPPHERDRILQSMTEGFPAHYQRILERYYKKLATETPVGADDGSAPSDAAPASTKPAAEPVGAAADKAGAAPAKATGASGR